MAKKQKSFDAELDALLAGVELPSDEEVNWETKYKNRSTNPNWIKSVKQQANKRVNDKKWREENANRNKNQVNDPAYQKALKEGIDKRSNNKEWRANVTDGAKKRAKDKNIIEKIGKASKERFNNPEWREKHQEKINQRTNDPEWREKQHIARLARTLAVVCNDGIFSTKQEAVLYASSNGLKNAGKKITEWLKNNENGYYYISREEFNTLKGKQ
jgi:hypothetical protein